MTTAITTSRLHLLPLALVLLAPPARTQNTQTQRAPTQPQQTQPTQIKPTGASPNSPATLSLRVRLEPRRTSAPPDPADAVVLWLTPTRPTASALHHVPLPAPHSFVIAQKDKQFSPHLLVIPTGSSVDFPNLDPFFHNVFSLFNGRRFDLGLYEAGSRRSVRFDHDGVSYIFCNIHPEMGAVIVSLSTPYFAVSKPDGTILLANLPPGDYDLNLWSQNVSTADSDAARQHLHLTAQSLTLPPITLHRTDAPSDRHLNKFGEAYKAPDHIPY